MRQTKYYISESRKVLAALCFKDYFTLERISFQLHTHAYTYIYIFVYIFVYIYIWLDIYIHINIWSEKTDRLICSALWEIINTFFYDQDSLYSLIGFNKIREHSFSNKVLNYNHEKQLIHHRIWGNCCILYGTILDAQCSVYL